MVLPRFLAELKHRNVYRAAVVYAAVGWALLEAADVVLPRLGLPDWTVNVVLAVILLGFPLAIVFAWIFDISAQGIVRTEPLSSTGLPHRLNVAAIVEFVLIVALVVVVGSLYVDRLSLHKRLVEAESAAPESPGTGKPEFPSPEQYRAIAVLPLADMSEAGDQAWFAEGIAEELLHALAGVEGLQVMARTSSFAFKGTDKTIAEIAEILGVQAVLEGSVRRSGERIRITAQLVDASSGYHIWSGSYERSEADIFQLQDEIARSIVATLKLELGVDKNVALIPVSTSNLEAYNAFIRGRAALDWANPDTLTESIEYFEMAVAADPKYADAWGYLAYAHGFMALWQSTEQISIPTTVAYQKALALDPQQSEALTVKAWMKQLLEWDWGSAGKLYRQALASRDNPNAMLAYGIFYLPIVDEIPRAIELLREAERLDPLQAGFKSNLAMLHIWSGNPKAAIQKAKEALALSPKHIFAQMALVEAYILSGNCGLVLKIVGALPEPLRNEPRILGRLGVCHALMGEEDRAREIYQHVKETTPYYYANMQAAVLAMTLGEVEDALDILESEIDKHAWTCMFIRIYFRNNESLKDNPRFLSILERIGLGDKSIIGLQGELTI
jgi:TolB-like protein/Tfp pilus assembly protein PilF